MASEDHVIEGYYRFPGYEIRERVTIQQYTHGFVLYLNSIFDKAEEMTAVAFAATYDDLVNWYHQQQCDTWKDIIDGKTYTKNFKKDSVLENYNPPCSLVVNEHGVFGDGICEDDYIIDAIPSSVHIIAH